MRQMHCLSKLSAISALLCLSCLFSVDSTAQTWSPTTNISNNFGVSQLPDIIIDTSGNPHVVWNDNTLGNHEIFYSRFNGTSWSIPVNISNSAVDSSRPKIAIDSSGNPHVVWKDDILGSASGNHEIFYSRFDGTSWSTPTNISNNPQISSFPDIAIDALGNPHVVWLENPPGMHFEIFYSRFNGTSWSVPINISNSTETSIIPAIAIDTTGNPHVVWYEPTKIMYSRFNGTSWSIPITISNVSIEFHSSILRNFPAIAIDASGKPHVVWEDRLLSVALNFSIFYSRFNGTSWSVPINISQTAPLSFSFRPVIGIGALGNPHVVWHNSTPASNLEIFYNRFNGTSWSTPSNISNNAGRSIFPAIAIDVLGNIHVVWDDDTPSNNEIFYLISLDTDGDGIFNTVDEKPFTAMTCSNTSPFACTNSDFNDSLGNLGGVTSGKVKNKAPGVSLTIQDEIPNPAKGVRVIASGSGDTKLNLPGAGFEIDGTPVSNANYVFSAPANFVVTKTSSALLEVTSGSVMVEFTELGITALVEAGESLHLTERSAIDIVLTSVVGEVTITITINGQKVILKPGESFSSELVIEIDVKPGSFPNSVNPNGRGIIPVAILTNGGFEATKVDPLSVKFGPAGATEVHQRGYIEDVDGDGDPDLLLHFETSETGIKAGDTEVSLTGKTVDGRTLKGKDSILTPPKSKLAPSKLVTALLNPNPNPSNPETWIPFVLEKGANVTISIFGATGQLIRTLDMGYRAAGAYISRDKAAYWDGKNEAGEKVSSGLYFITMKAGAFVATRKMAILK